MLKPLAFAALLLAAPAASLPPDPPYRLVVVSESGDIATWLRVQDGKLVTERVVPLGIMPADIDGPHNVAVAPDQKSYYVTIAHGTPFGTLWRLDAKNDTLIGRAQVELFPTTIALTPDGEFAFVANSDFHGDRPRVNPVSIVHTPTMTKITDLPVCDMPHGVKVNHAGTKAWVSCMHSDELVEIDISTLGTARRIKVGAGHKGAGGHEVNQHAGHAAPSAPAGERANQATSGPDLTKECAPTFVAISPDDSRLYAACNTSYTLQVWDANSARLIKEVSTGKGAYNVEISPDGKLAVVTNKKDQSVSLFDTATLTEVARIPTTKKIVHGVAFSPDGKYAFISQESIGADPGAVDMIDLATRRTVATLPIPAQPTGISVQQL